MKLNEYRNLQRSKYATYDKAIECAYLLYIYFISDIKFTEFEVKFLNGEIREKMINLLNKTKEVL